MNAEFVTSAFNEKQYPAADRPEVAFAGKSKVGKSSLINTLVNRKKLARTSATPGRTQSINFFRLGKSLYLVDLPGYGFARVPVNVKRSWKEMVETYLRTRPTLKAVVVILDRLPKGFNFSCNVIHVTYLRFFGNYLSEPLKELTAGPQLAVCSLLTLDRKNPDST